MRAGRDGVRGFALPGARRGLLSLLVALCLAAVAGTATAAPARAGIDPREDVSISHSAAWQLPRALPERLQAKHVVPPQTVGAGVLAAAVPPARPAAPSYRPTAVAACCGTTLPAWAGRAPPSLL